MSCTQTRAAGCLLTRTNLKTLYLRVGISKLAPIFDHLQRLQASSKIGDLLVALFYLPNTIEIDMACM